MLCDEILALYLYRLSNRINSEYWKEVALPFVILFRECLNEYGWAKKVESDGIKSNGCSEPSITQSIRQKIQNQEFCLINNCEHAPEICNEFVTVYMEGK